MPKSRTESVDEWVAILEQLIEAGEIKLSPEDDLRREAWRLAQHEDELARLRALACEYGEEQAPCPACNHEVIRRLIDEARGIRISAQVLADLPHAQRYEPLVAKLQGIAQAAQAILDGLYKLP